MPLTQTTTKQFAPGGMAAYNNMTPQMASTLGQFMTNPLQSSFFAQNQQLANNQIGQQGQSQMSTLLNNMRQMGMGGGSSSSPFLTSQIAQQGRATSGQLSNSFMQNLLGMNQMRLGAANTAAGYNPLQTGQTQSTGGLGSWLGPIAGAGLGMLSGGLLGGKNAFAGGTPMTAGNMAMPSPFTMGQQSPFAGSPMAPPIINGGNNNMPGFNGLSQMGNPYMT